MSWKQVSPWHYLRIAAMMAGILLLAACMPQTQATTDTTADGAAATASEEPVTVLWWHSHGGSTGELMDQFAADFSALDNNIIVQSEYQGGYIDHLNKLIAGAAAGALPDMIHIGDGQYTPLALNGILLPLDDLIAGPDGLNLDTYKLPIYRGVQDGKMYQLAYGVSTPIFYTNQEALEAAGLEGAPGTWDEFFDVYLPALAEANPDIVPFVYGPGSWWQQSPVWSYGVMVDDVDTFEIDMANPLAIEWFERMQQARKDGLVYVPTEADGGIGAFFGSGLAAMTIDSTGLIGNIDNISEGKFTAETHFLPEGPGGRWVPSGGNGLSIISGRSEEVTNAAWEFIKYLHSAPVWAEYDRATGYIPIQNDVEAAIADVIEADPRRQVAIDQFEYSRWHMRIHYSSARGDEAIKDAWNEIIQTDVDPAERLQRLQEDLCRIAREEGFEPTCVGE